MKYNLTNIPEVKLNDVEHFYVIGSRHKDGILGVENQKVDLKEIGGAAIDERELIRRTISTANPLKRIIFWEDLVYLAEGTGADDTYVIYGVKDSADLESLSKMPLEEEGNGNLTMFNTAVQVEFNTLKQLTETGLGKISLDVIPTYTLLNDTFEYSPVQTDNGNQRAWDMSDFVSTTAVYGSGMNLGELSDEMREEAPFQIPDDVHYFLQVTFITQEVS